MKEFERFLKEKSTIKPSDAFEREFAYYCYDYICELGYADLFSSNKNPDKVYFEKLLKIIWYKYLKVFKEYTDLTFWGPHVLEERNKHKVYDIKPLIKLDLEFSIKYEELLFQNSSQSDLDSLIESTFIDQDGQNIISDLEKVYEISNLPEYYSQFYSFHYNIAKGSYESASQFASLPYTRFGVFDNNNAVSWHFGLLSQGIKYPLNNKIFDTHRYADRYKSKWFKENESQIREEFDRQMDNYFEKNGDNFVGIILRKFLENLPTIEGKDGVKSYLKQLEEFDIKTNFRKDESFFEIDRRIKNAESINDFNFTSEYFKFDIPVKERVRLESTEGFKTPNGLPGFMYYSLMDENIIGFMKKAENKIRSQSGKHKVGERWENETRVFKGLKDKLPDNYKLYREYLIWADGAKRFDCFIENKNVAVEYNGEQHYKPIDFFGGESAFKRRKASDQLKKEYCEENNIDLFVIRYDEEIEERVDEIVSKILT